MIFKTNQHQYKWYLCFKCSVCAVEWDFSWCSFRIFQRFRELSPKRVPADMKDGRARNVKIPFLEMELMAELRVTECVFVCWCYPRTLRHIWKYWCSYHSVKYSLIFHWKIKWSLFVCLLKTILADTCTWNVNHYFIG